MYTYHRILSTALLLYFYFAARSQSHPPIKTLMDPIDNIRKRSPMEKLYLHTDRDTYAAADTIWFKAYLMDADLQASNTLSGLLYIELDDSNNRALKHMMAPIIRGVSWGNIIIDETGLADGIYTLRAYTNQMRNFGEDLIFKKSFYITATVSEPRLINAAFKATQKQGKSNIAAEIQLTDLNKAPVQVKDMQLKVMDGRHNLISNKVTTTLDGKLNFNFDLPIKTPEKDLSITLQSIVNGTLAGTKQTIPVKLDRPENTDLQFMPEGGDLVADLPTRVAFKAIGENGSGTALQGTIYDSKQAAVATFATGHAGMGVFNLTPWAGNSYTAVIKLPDGTSKTYPLPPVAAKGTVMNITAKGADSAEITLAATPDMIGTNGTWYLIGQSRDVPCYGATIHFTKPLTKIMISTSLFPTGVARFSLLNSDRVPLNERIVYINHHDELHLQIRPDRKIYAPHDSIALQLQVADHTGKPVTGSFSLAVTDDNQVRTDTLASNILNDMLLTSDLKGNVEDPAWYLDTDNPERLAALDALLLTQGWIGYDWKQIYGPPVKPAFDLEPSFQIKGKVDNLFGKPVTDGEVIMMSKKPKLFALTATGPDGRFTFKGINPIDTAVFLIQARTKSKKDFGVGLKVDELVPPVFTAAAPPVVPWYVNSDSISLHNQYARLAYRRDADKVVQKGTLLNNVVIQGKKIVRGSQNLNGPGEADQVFDEQDMEKAGKTSLADLLLKIIGYLFRGMWHPCDTCSAMPTYHMIKDKKINFIFDGIDVNFLYGGNSYGPNGQKRFDFLKQVFDQYTAEDIKGIEVMSSSQYVARYGLHFLDPEQEPNHYAYVEITTREGNGPYLKTSANSYLYRPTPFTLPKQFYRPRYTANTKPPVPDKRATIHWEPQIIPDAAGHATVTFYSADKPGKYTVILQGADMNGSVGYQRATVVIK